MSIRKIGLKVAGGVLLIVGLSLAMRESFIGGSLLILFGFFLAFPNSYKKAMADSKRIKKAYDYDLRTDIERRFIGGVFMELLLCAEKFISADGLHATMASIATLESARIDLESSDLEKAVKRKIASEEVSEASQSRMRREVAFLQAINAVKTHFSTVTRLIEARTTDPSLKSDATADQLYFQGRNLIRQLAEAEQVRLSLMEKTETVLGVNQGFEKRQKQVSETLPKDIESPEQEYDLTTSLEQHFSPHRKLLEASMLRFIPVPAEGERDFAKFTELRKSYEALIAKDDTVQSEHVFLEAQKLISRYKLSI